MKLSIRFALFSAIMVVVAIAMYQLTVWTILPWLMSSDNELVLSLGLVLGVLWAFVVFCGIGEYVGKKLKCDELIDKFLIK